MLAAPAAALAITAAHWRIDYAANITGREAIYSAAVGSPAPLAVVSPDQADVDYSSPVPSPDGRYLAFSDGRQELLARADGSGVRVLTSSPVTPVWSPDSTRIAWIAYGRSEGGALHVARADSHGDRVVLAFRTDNRYFAGAHVVWSRDSRGVHVRPGLPPTSEHAGHPQARSPDGRLLAYTTSAGIAIIDVRTRRTRLLTHDLGSQLTWSPDSTMLAYVNCCTNPNPLGVGDIRAVTRTGTVDVVVPASSAGVVTALAWARSDSSASYRPDPAALYAPGPVRQLAADGTGVAYAACSVVFSWTPADGNVTGPTVTHCDPYDSLYVDTLALAGREVAYGRICCNNVKSWTLWLDTFGQSPQLLLSGGGDVCCTSYPVLAGRGSLLAYAAPSGFPDYLWTVRTPGGPPLISFVQDRFVAVGVDIDGDRILVAHDGAVDVVLSENGGTVFHLDLPTGATPDAQLDGEDVAVRDGTNVDVYAVDGGALLHTWPLPDGAKLQDAAHGLLAFTTGGEIDVLRLSDGFEARVMPGTLAAFMDAGLATADGPRIRLTPYRKLPAGD